jgi:hypothetical protein
MQKPPIQLTLRHIQWIKYLRDVKPELLGKILAGEEITTEESQQFEEYLKLNLEPDQ